MGILLLETVIATEVTPIRVIADQEAEPPPAPFQHRVEALDIPEAAVIPPEVVDQGLQAFPPEVAVRAQAPDQDPLVLQEVVVDNKKAT